MSSASKTLEQWEQTVRQLKDGEISFMAFLEKCQAHREDLNQSFDMTMREIIVDYNKG